MASPRRQSLVYSIEEHAKGHIEKHKAIINDLLDAPMGASNTLDIIMSELEELSYYEDQLALINKHLK